MAHLKTLKYLNFAIGLYTSAIGLLFFFMFVLPGLFIWFEEGELPGLVFVGIGLVAFIGLVAVGVGHFFLGLMVSSGRGRVWQAFIAILQISSFPLGTAYALYALWVCFVNPASVRQFESPLKPPVR